jgi:hypothetical protein
VNPFVFLQIDGSTEAAVADLALVVADARVDLVVDGERVLAGELLSAELTLEAILRNGFGPKFTEEN